MTSCCRVYKVLSFQHQITPDEDTRTGVSKRWVVDAILCGDCIHQNKTSVAVKYVGFNTWLRYSHKFQFDT